MSSAVEPLLGSAGNTPLRVLVPVAGSGERPGGKLFRQYKQHDCISMLERTIKRLHCMSGLAGMVVFLAIGDSFFKNTRSSGEQSFA